MSISRVIEVSFGGGSIAYAKVDTAYFYNNGILFKPTDIDLPASYQVHWADSPQASSTLETIGTAEGAPIPDDLWNRSRVIYGWIYLHPTEDSGVTGYEVRIYKNVRAGLPDGTEPTPEEQSVIDQAISALNTAVAKTAQDAESAEQAKDDAESARDNAQTYANNAQSSAQASARSAESASESARVATEKATASAESASASAQIKADVEDLVDDAQSYAESALIASQASVTARNTAQGYAQSASASAQSASTSASNASASANTASSKATEASTSAQTASAKATEASQSASQALSYKTDAESAKTASQTAQGLAESARDTAVSAKDDAESARDDAVQAKEDAESAVASISGALDDKAPIIADTASGAIASFTDGADNLPLKSLVVNINPVQDLHGQDAPYPAGSTANQLDLSSCTFNRCSLVSIYDGSVKLNIQNAYFATVGYTGNAIPEELRTRILNGEPITFEANNNNGYSISIVVYGTRSNGSSYQEINGYNNFVTITPTLFTAVTSIEFRFQRTGTQHTDTTTVMTGLRVSYGDTATTFQPYENLCPISGWTEVDVEQSGKNLFDEVCEKGLINPSTGADVANNGLYRSKNYIRVAPNTTYYVLNSAHAVTNNASIRLCFYDKNKTFIESPVGSAISRAFTTPNNAYYVRFFVNDNIIYYASDISINYPSTDHDYHAYTGNSYSISWETEAGTVYGGKLDVLSGVLTVYPYYASYNGETLTGEWISDRDKYVSGTTPTIGAQVVNIGAQGVTVQLEPHEVESLYGVNNLWADSGDTEVEYRADTKLYIAKKIAEALASLT